MPPHVDVCVVGSANLDLVATAPRLPSAGETVLGTAYAEHAGGKGLNQAVAAARSGARTAFVGALGRDAAGAELRSVLDDAGIDLDAVADVDAPTGRALITVNEQGENSIVVVPGANAHVSADAALPPSAVVLVQLEVPVHTVRAALGEARRRGATTVLNPAPAAPLDRELLSFVDVLVPNEHEVGLVGGTSALLDVCPVVVVTRGSEGVDVVTTSGTRHVDAFDVSVVDTTGAGDAFCGSLAARLAAGDELLDAVRWGAAAGALATTVRGAVPAQPSEATIRQLLGS
ncbi:MAG: ribokinase [Ilumatobacter sp.]|uniref:ribokinase n=1 Tax=Ilumatobacter sp. TaxID=1967498 RepID=UPI0026358FBA|nr:ribokinase [Ilumatobacter sp.]MDJ0768725.1 ribokinase [Ilumatobacter sp.]